MTTRKKLIKQLRAIAERKGITHQAMATKLKWERPTVSRALSGSQNLTIDSLIALAKVLDATVEVRESNHKISESPS